MKFRTLVAMTAAATALTAGTAMAADAAPAEPAAPKAWSDTIKFYGWAEAGILSNPDTNKLNFGHSFTDHADQLQLNQLVATVERPIDSSSSTIDFGFKLQGMFGSDARYTHFLGEFDRALSDRTQVDIVEANVTAHLPFLAKDGIDVKIGQYPTLEGAEVIPAAGNALYSKSYLFNYGIPLKHTGIMTVSHLDPKFDLYLGVDTGVNTTFPKRGDPNDAVAFHGGIGLNLGKLTVLATTHIGPEDVRGTPGIRANHDLRYLNDMVVTYKPNAKLTSVTDFNYIKDDGFNAEGYGVTQFLTYSVNDKLSVTGRAEVWRDAQGFFVFAFPGNYDFVNVERGLPNTSFGPAVPTTYGEITFGLTYKPTVPGINGLLIRPEVRYDNALNGTKAYAELTKRDQFTFGFDVVLPFGKY